MQASDLREQFSCALSATSGEQKVGCKSDSNWSSLSLDVSVRAPTDQKMTAR